MPDPPLTDSTLPDPPLPDPALPDPASNAQRARALYDSGSLAEAQALYDEAVHTDPRHYESLHMLGVIAMRMGDPAKAVQLIGRAIALEPRKAAAYCNRGLALERLGNPQAAVADYDSAIALEPRFWGGYFNRAKAQRTQGRLEEALASYDLAIAINGNCTAAFANRGEVLLALQRWEAALASFDRAISLEPQHADAQCNRGAALVKLGRRDAALASFDAAIAMDPAHLEAHYNRGRVQQDLQHWQPALESYERALAIKPDYAAGHLNRGIVLEGLGRWQDALASYDRALAHDANLPEAEFNRGNLLARFKQPRAALESYERAMAVKPALEFLRGQRRHTQMQLCDWEGFESDLTELAAAVERGAAACPPFAFLALSESAALQRRAAEIWVRGRHLNGDPLPAVAKRGRTGKIRVGYFSADFHQHPVSALTAELIETHDRMRFDVSALAFGPNTQDAMRKRLQDAFDQFIDVERLSDPDIARLARRMELDIAVDLGGHTRSSRPGIFAARAAPIQVNFLGYPGTLGAPFIDYMIADRTLVPPAHRQHYAEKILYLPSYQPNDSTRRIAGGPLDREAHGLPGAGFVYCCFNNSYKITPPVFDVWMRILHQVPGSVLWMRSAGSDCTANLTREALARGIPPERLRFAPRLDSMEDHLARYRLADLFLDTWPFGAHTTAGDALWAGLPILTCAGESFASRVGASLLASIGLSDLIAASVHQYESLAVALAADGRRLAELRRRLAEGRLVAPLFDIHSYTKNLESGYTAILERHRAGLPPEDIHIEPGLAARNSGRSGGDQDFHFDR